MARQWVGCAAVTEMTPSNGWDRYYIVHNVSSRAMLRTPDLAAAMTFWQEHGGLVRLIDKLWENGQCVYRVAADLKPESFVESFPL